MSEIIVPRDPPNEKKVTREIEAFLIKYFSTNDEEPFTYKELLEFVRNKFSTVYGWELDAHVAWALDMLHTNHLIKRVGPRIWEAIDGPDEVYSERETGYAPEGEFVHRGKNFNQVIATFNNKADYNKEVKKTEVSVKMLKDIGKTPEEIEVLMNSSKTPFNPVVVKVIIRKLFNL